MSEQFSYIPLHVHSCYSINDGLQNVGDIVKRAAALHIPALALTDCCNAAGFIRFYEACHKAGIKPILGADLRFYAEPQPGQAREPFMLTLLARDRRGRQNLYDLLSRAWLDSQSPDIDEVMLNLDALKDYGAGLFVLNGFRGDIARLCAAREQQKLQQRLDFYQGIFGQNFCLELTRTERSGEKEFEQAALRLCEQRNIPPVATNDTRFLLGPFDVPQDGFSDYDIHDIRVAIQRSLQHGSDELKREYSAQQYLRSPVEMQELFADLPEALENTRAIAACCNVTLELDHPRLPHYNTGKLSAADYLRQTAHEGLEKRLQFLFPEEQIREQKRPEYEQRLEMELDVIIKMDFPGYFLIVMEFIQWSKRHGVPVGPGRGSGGGSLVAYALEITDFDPIRFDLFFERFLNPQRVSMPDFDIDFCQKKRELTLKHVVEHYGRDAVSQIAAFGTLAPKAAIQGAGRALGVPLGQVRRIADMIPAKPGVTFKEAMGLLKDKEGNPLPPTSPELHSFYQNALNTDDRGVLELIHASMRLEGVIRSIGKHAAGVVISPTRISEFSPEMLDADGNPITQYDKKDVEHAGLVKFDFLGLTTLTIIDEAKEMIDEKLKREGKEPLNVAAIPLDDPQSFEMLQQCETTAVFQLESGGMRKLIGQMRPDRFDDLIALVALFRPGPIQSGMVDHFVKRKHGLEQVSYPDEQFQDLDLKPVLDSTYGVIVYQEQVMQLAQVLAGYTLGGADILRRAMGKKIPSEMKKQLGTFLEGAKNKGKDVKIAEKIFEQVEKFAEYGFNKSHSAAYALVAWWTLWLKVHYPAQFLAAMMTADSIKTEKLITYIAEARRLGVKVSPPDVNVGKFSFGVNEQGDIIYGFSAIKGVGEGLVEQLVAERQKTGPYLDIFDFTRRVGTEFLTKSTLEAFIKAGAFDSIGPSRAAMYASIPTALKYAQQTKKDTESHQLDLFSGLDDSLYRPSYPEVPKWSERMRLHYEKQLLGLYLSGHPIDSCREELMMFCGGTTLESMQPGAENRPNRIRVAAVLTAFNKRPSSKNDGDFFYVVSLDDATTTTEFFVYSNAAQQLDQLLAQQERNTKKRAKSSGGEDQIPAPLVLLLEGLYGINKDGVARFRVQSVTSLEELRSQKARSITLRFDRQTLQRCGGRINELIERNRIAQQELHAQLLAGNENVCRGCRVEVVVDDQHLKLHDATYRLRPSDDLIEGLHAVAGPAAVQLNYS